MNPRVLRTQSGDQSYLSLESAVQRWDLRAIAKGSSWRHMGFQTVYCVREAVDDSFRARISRIAMKLQLQITTSDRVGKDRSQD